VYSQVRSLHKASCLLATSTISSGSRCLVAAGA